MLMISAMIMIASCGSKSNSEEIEFTDPAILQAGKIDVSGYFSAESVSKPSPSAESQNGYTHYPIKTSVKLKVLKSLADLKLDETLGNELRWTAELCDENETVLAEAKATTPIQEVNSYEEGKNIVLNCSTDWKDSWDEDEINHNASKIKKVRIKVEVFILSSVLKDYKEKMKSLGL